MTRTETLHLATQAVADREKRYYGLPLSVPVAEMLAEWRRNVRKVLNGEML